MGAAAPSSTTLVLRAPAKVNLGLRILGRRPDGYHLLESLFVPFESAPGTGLADRLRLRIVPDATGVALSLRGGDAAATAGVPRGAPNLAARAAEAFLAAGGLRARVEIELEKAVPSGGGLGGGSSDAGAVLRGLAGAFPGAVSRARLRVLAASLGADVPFFLDPRPAWVGGVGERIEPAGGVPRLALLLAHPGISLDTAAVYAEWDARGGALTPSGPRPTMRPASGPEADPQGLRRPPPPAAAPVPSAHRLSRGAPGRAGPFARRIEAGLLHNDLEAAAVRLCPSIRVLRERIEARGAIGTGMSGSGATVYGVFADPERAQEALAALRVPAGTWLRVATTAPSPGSAQEPGDE